MKTIYLFKGLPASGKTTEAKRMIAEHPGSFKRVNKDDLRDMLDGGKWSRDNEKLVLRVRDATIGAALDDGKHVIVDDTNLHPKHLARVKQIASQREDQVKVEERFFDCDVEECIARDLARTRSVGEKVIRKMHRDFLAEPFSPREQDPSKKDCIIVDVDGTIALLNGRDPYDASTCENDAPNLPVVALVNYLAQMYSVILVSGRSDKYREETERWLSNYLVVYQALHMRPEGDYRKDAVLKAEIFGQHIEPEWYVHFVLDDRNQTVEGWRRLGLPCFQVAEGDF